MVSLFSLFSKKRPKSAVVQPTNSTAAPVGSPPSPTKRPLSPPSPPKSKTPPRLHPSRVTDSGHGPSYVRGDGDSVPRRVSVDLATRSKSPFQSVSELDSARQRSSMYIPKSTLRSKAKAKARQRGAASPTFSQSPSPPRLTIDLPFEARCSHDGRETIDFDVNLGLDGVGRTPILTPAERTTLNSLSFEPAEVADGWKWIGAELLGQGPETVGIMLPRRLVASKDRQRQILALFALAIRPDLSSQFPSLTSTYPGVSADGASKAWKDRLLSVAHDANSPIDLAEVLKTLLRRLTDGARPVVDPATFVRFVQQEHAASYPRTAYASMLVPLLKPTITGLLDAVLEVCNGIALHADSNAMSAGRLCHIIGWWILGEFPKDKGEQVTYNDLYDAYRLAGQRTEHLFYARIRWQSTQQKMPRRLIQLILNYPFGESSASSEHLPFPPASTFPRRVLHVGLATDDDLPRGTDPIKAIEDALVAKLDSDVVAEKWTVLRVVDARPVTLGRLLSDDANSFLDEVAVNRSAEMPISSNSNLSDSPNRRRSQSFGGLSNFDVPDGDRHTSEGEDLGRPMSPSPIGTQRPIWRQSSAINLSPRRKPGGWDDFLVSGFGEESDLVKDISSTLNKPKTPAKSATLQSRGYVSPPAPKRVTIQTHTSLLISNEEVVDVDDTFVSFVEDGQLDPIASSTWPRFALVQLAEPIRAQDESTPADHLLVTVDRRVHKRPVSVDEPLPDFALNKHHEGSNVSYTSERSRPFSPSIVESTSSRFSTFNLASLANSFRRTSIYSTGSRSHSRMSFFNSAPSKIAARPEPLDTVQERAKAIGHAPKNSRSSEAPTEYTIGEMGEIVLIPNPARDELTTEVPSTTVYDSAMESANAVGETLPAEWVLLGEGGAHVVFRYRGTDPILQGRAIRFAKLSPSGSGNSSANTAWNNDLIGKVFPDELLIKAIPTTVSGSWAHDLVEAAEKQRPTERRRVGPPLTKDIDFSRVPEIMNDLTAGSPGHKVLAVEIKPKCGFLPNPDTLTPPESVSIKAHNSRYTLHEHYRGYKGCDGKVTYDPIDLYSGDAVRVREAMNGLWAQWRASDGSKNNLRISVDGHKVLPKDSHLIPRSSKEAQESINDATFDLVAPLLEKCGVLATLKALQSTLDAFDISTLTKEYAREVGNNDGKPFANVAEPTVAELEEFIQVYKANPTETSAWTTRQKLIAYALSAIFKDCSIIVRSVLSPNGDGTYGLVNDKSTVNVIDVDLKPLSSLSKWAELDEKLWRHWASTKSATEHKVASEAPRTPEQAVTVVSEPPVEEANGHGPKVVAVTATAGAAGIAALIASGVESVAAGSTDDAKATDSPAASLHSVQGATHALANFNFPSTSTELLAHASTEIPSAAVAPHPSIPETENETPAPISAEGEQLSDAQRVAASEPEPVTEAATTAEPAQLVTEAKPPEPAPGVDTVEEVSEVNPAAPISETQPIEPISDPQPTEPISEAESKVMPVEPVLVKPSEPDPETTLAHETRTDATEAAPVGTVAEHPVERVVQDVAPIAAVTTVVATEEAQPESTPQQAEARPNASEPANEAQKVLTPASVVDTAPVLAKPVVQSKIPSSPPRAPETKRDSSRPSPTKRGGLQSRSIRDRIAALEAASGPKGFQEVVREAHVERPTSPEPRPRSPEKAIKRLSSPKILQQSQFFQDLTEGSKTNPIVKSTSTPKDLTVGKVGTTGASVATRGEVATTPEAVEPEAKPEPTGIQGSVIAKDMLSQSSPVVKTVELSQAAEIMPEAEPPSGSTDGTPAPAIRVVSDPAPSLESESVPEVFANPTGPLPVVEEVAIAAAPGSITPASGPTRKTSRTRLSLSPKPVDAELPGGSSPESISRGKKVRNSIGNLFRKTSAKFERIDLSSSSKSTDHATSGHNGTTPAPFDNGTDAAATPTNSNHTTAAVLVTGAAVAAGSAAVTVAKVAGGEHSTQKVDPSEEQPVVSGDSGPPTPTPAARSVDLADLPVRNDSLVDASPASETASSEANFVAATDGLVQSNDSSSTTPQEPDGQTTPPAAPEQLQQQGLAAASENEAVAITEPVTDTAVSQAVELNAAPHRPFRRPSPLFPSRGQHGESVVASPLNKEFYAKAQLPPLPTDGRAATGNCDSLDLDRERTQSIDTTYDSVRSSIDNEGSVFETAPATPLEASTPITARNPLESSTQQQGLTTPVAADFTASDSGWAYPTPRSPRSALPRLSAFVDKMDAPKIERSVSQSTALVQSDDDEREAPEVLLLNTTSSVINSPVLPGSSSMPSATGLVQESSEPSL